MKGLSNPAFVIAAIFAAIVFLGATRSKERGLVALGVVLLVMVVLALGLDGVGSLFGGLSDLLNAL